MASKKSNLDSEKRLIEIGKGIVRDIYNKKNPTITLPVRALSNVRFDHKTKKILLGKTMANRYFFNLGHSKKFLQTVEIASISKDLLNEDKHASLRDVFYMAKRTIQGTKIDLVEEQEESDNVIEDLELISGNTREQLNINANKNGSIAGKVVIVDKGDSIDWSKMGSGGWSIPSNVENITFKKVDAKYVLYMEKAAVWERLHEDKFWEKNNCIIISSQGQTTRGIRRLLQRLNQEHKLPIYVLTDLDSWGHYIYSVIKFGSINLAHVSESLALGDVRFLGIRVKDIERYGLQKHLIKFKENDLSRLKQIMNYAWFKDNKAWQKEFEALKKLNAKAEIQALSSRGISFISEKYLPEKIKEKDFLD